MSFISRNFSVFSSFLLLLVFFSRCCWPVCHTLSDVSLAVPATLAYRFPRASPLVLFTELAIDHWFYRNLLLQHNESSGCPCAAWQLVDGRSLPPPQGVAQDTTSESQKWGEQCTLCPPPVHGSTTSSRISTTVCRTWWCSSALSGTALPPALLTLYKAVSQVDVVNDLLPKDRLKGEKRLWEVNGGCRGEGWWRTARRGPACRGE